MSQYFGLKYRNILKKDLKDSICDNDSDNAALEYNIYFIMSIMSW